jgi:hypothetical protein
MLRVAQSWRDPKQVLNMIIAWTGHRPDLFRDPAQARDIVESTAREFAARGVRFLLGGQRGVDTWAALAAVARGVPFDVVLPFDVDVFTRDWDAPSDRAVLEETLAQAADVRIAGGYSLRNQIVAESADLLIVVWTATAGGGTAETLTLARAAGTPIREIVLPPSALASSAEGRGI